MKNRIYTLLILGFFSIQVIAQVPTNYTVTDDPTNTNKFNVSVTLDSDGSPSISNSTIVALVPNGTSAASASGIVSGGSWATNLTSNTNLLAACPDAGTFAMIQITLTGDAQISDAVANTAEPIATITLTGAAVDEEIRLLNPSGSGLDACLKGLGITNTATIDPDGNSGTAPAVSYQDISGVGSIILPIRLLSFEAVKGANNTVNLNWTTSSEVNGSHYDIERSTDGENWFKVGKIDAIGESSTVQSYNFVDTNLPLNLRDLEKSFYYRLNMIDNDGSQEYSDVREVTFIEGGIYFTVYPNPSVNEVFVNLTSEANDNMPAQLTIYTIDGKKVQDNEIDNGVDTRVNMTNMNVGTYLFSVKQGDKTYMKQVVKSN